MHYFQYKNYCSLAQREALLSHNAEAALPKAVYRKPFDNCVEYVEGQISMC